MLIKCAGLPKLTRKFSGEKSLRNKRKVVIIHAITLYENLNSITISILEQFFINIYHYLDLLQFSMFQTQNTKNLFASLNACALASAGNLEIFYFLIC